MQKLIITDRIFGRHTITSPVLIELITSKPVQRLKRIGQNGQPTATDPLPFLHTRYDHSIGVMLLLKLLGATEEEQIAGLLHDVSHTAFSHSIDLVVGREKKEDFQDSNHQAYILNSSIPTILGKYKYDVHRIYDYHHFTLLEQDIPYLCADRIDYSLRSTRKIFATICLPKLRVHKGKIVFIERKAAKIFADMFLSLQQNAWGGEDHVIREQIFVQGLKYAVGKILILDDFWQDDAFILNKLHEAKNEVIEKMFKDLSRKSYVDLPKSNKIVRKKFRFVDPAVLINGETHKVSEIDTSFKTLLTKAKKENEKGIALPLL